MIEEWRGEFDREETMALARPAGGDERRSALMIEGQRSGRHFNGLLRTPERGAALQVQAQFHTARMKAARPVEFFRVGKIVPLEAEAEPAEVAKEWTPARAHRAPSRCFGEGGSVIGRGCALCR